MIGSINDWKSKMGMSLLLHIRGNLGELGEGGLEVFDDFGGDEFFHSDVTPFLFLNANKLSRFTDVSVSNFRVSLRTKC